MSDHVIIEQHWCLTEDRDRVVPETDPAARWLHWTPGQQVPRAEAQRLGALQAAPEPEAVKAAKAPANKARPRPADKGI